MTGPSDVPIPAQDAPPDGGAGGVRRFWRYLRASAAPYTVPLLVGVLIGAAMFWYGAWRHWAGDYVVRTTGTPAAGRVADTAILGRKYKAYLVLVSYRPQGWGVDRLAWANVDNDTHRRLGRGAPVTLRYLPAEPDRIWIEGDNPNTPWMLALALPLLVGPLEVARVLRLAARRAWRTREGATALGEIVAIVEPPGWPAPEALRDLHYAFTAPDGVRREGVFSGLPHRIGIFARPGDPIQVAYDPGNPDRHEPDIFGMDALSPCRRRSGQAGERGNQRPPAGGGGGGP